MQEVEAVGNSAPRLGTNGQALGVNNPSMHTTELLNTLKATAPGLAHSRHNILYRFRSTGDNKSIIDPTLTFYISF